MYGVSRPDVQYEPQNQAPHPSPLTPQPWTQPLDHKAQVPSDSPRDPDTNQKQIFDSVLRQVDERDLHR